jgi:isopentenyl-diphosphate delta-isomerase
MSLISIVDNSDRVIGTADYDRVHKNGLLHRMILVYIFDKDGRFLLQKRANEKPHGGLLGESLCAHVREGEDYIDTARRRMREELGLVVSNDDLHEVTKAHVYTEEKDWKNNTFAKIYECTTPVSPISPNPSETQEILFYPIEKVLRLFHESPSSFVPGFKDTFSEYLKIRYPDKLRLLNN